MQHRVYMLFADMQCGVPKVTKKVKSVICARIDKIDIFLRNSYFFNFDRNGNVGTLASFFTFGTRTECWSKSMSILSL